MLLARCDGCAGRTRCLLRVHDNFADGRYWNMLREAVEAAYPDDPRMRLSRAPMNRNKHGRFRYKYLNDHLLGVMHNMIEQAAVEAAMSMGMMNPDTGSLTNPDPSSFTTADGCWLRALTSLTRDQAVDPETGEIIGRFDRDAIPYHDSDGEWSNSPGHLLVMVLARNPLRERTRSAVHAAQVRQEPRSEPQRRDHRLRHPAGSGGEVPPDASRTEWHGL